MTTMAITCQLFAQFNSINTILYYLPENLTWTGFTIKHSLLYTGASALIYCGGTIPTMLFMDNWRWRHFLLVGSGALTAALALVGGLQFYSESPSQWHLHRCVHVLVLFWHDISHSIVSLHKFTWYSI
jgi:hypothetical protein